MQTGGSLTSGCLVIVKALSLPMPIGPGSTSVWLSLRTMLAEF